MSISKTPGNNNWLQGIVEQVRSSSASSQKQTNHVENKPGQYDAYYHCANDDPVTVETGDELNRDFQIDYNNETTSPKAQSFFFRNTQSSQPGQNSFNPIGEAHQAKEQDQTSDKQEEDKWLALSDIDYSNSYDGFNETQSNGSLRFTKDSSRNIFVTKNYFNPVAQSSGVK